MNNVIICEGMTDAILVNYYLGRTQGWQFTGKNLPFNFPMKNKATETGNWYAKEKDFCGIWGIGGKSNLDYALSEIIRIAEISADRVQRVVVMMDRDDEKSEEETIKTVEKHFKSSTPLENNKWASLALTDSFGKTCSIELLPLVIPFDRYGALETFLLDSLAVQDEHDKYVIDAARNFVKSLISAKYLPTERLKLKAELGVTFAVFSPQKVFTPLHALLEQIPWEDYNHIQTAFKSLDRLSK